jgi:anti-sigma B factor antagonist
MPRRSEGDLAESDARIGTPEDGTRVPMSFPARQSAAPEGRAQLTVVKPGHSLPDQAPRAVSTRAAEMSDLEPFAVETQRRDHVTIVQPRGELDMATVETLRSTLDVAIAETLRAALEGFETGARLVLDLRRLTFIDSTGLHLLVALDQRAQRDGFLLRLVAPAAPLDRAIQLCGLDQALPFVPAYDAVDSGLFRSTSDRDAAVDRRGDRAPDHAIVAGAGVGRDAARAARSANRGTSERSPG